MPPEPKKKDKDKKKSLQQVRTEAAAIGNKEPHGILTDAELNDLLKEIGTQFEGVPFAGQPEPTPADATKKKKKKKPEPPKSR